MSSVLFKGNGFVTKGQEQYPMHEMDQSVCHAFCAKSRANPGWRNYANVIAKMENIKND